LKLVGPWPDPVYEARVRKQIQESGLTDAVQILGKVSDEELHRQYATNQVFCLMSSCESFGIPAAESMCFGTPVVSTNCCAISEVCATAGLFGPVGDAAWTADALDRALTDNQQWQIWSDNAVERAARLTWEKCARAFRKIPELVGESLREEPESEFETGHVADDAFQARLSSH
jgi:glycosyltransferase involved in cell wall biosynthesis